MSKLKTDRPLLITPGEPAGIGPELTLQLMQYWGQHPLPDPGLGQPLPDLASLRLAAVADPDMLAERAAEMGIAVTINVVSTPDAVPPAQAGILNVLPVALSAPAQAGQLNPANASSVLQALGQATDWCRLGQAAALITGPMHKGVVNEAGIPFTGHTEFLQARCGVERVVMMLATEGLRVALVTTHLPLAQVADAITPERIAQVTRILAHDLQTCFGCADPRILVCGLNPHAGEGGHLGHEEIETIIPTLDRLRAEGLHLTGPLPADTLFTPHWLQQGDCVLAMYHDQGLPVLKFKGFGHAANITLGLPIIRTSVDHGTALDLAGQGIADAGSLHTALGYAVAMQHQRALHAGQA